MTSASGSTHEVLLVQKHFKKIKSIVEHPTDDARATSEPELVDYILGFVGKCTSVVVERDHSDDDHRKAVAKLLGTAHVSTPLWCIRLHLFACELIADELWSLPPEKADSYCGYIILRPTSQRHFGACVFGGLLLPAGWTLITAPYEVYIAGNSIRFEGIPWMEADEHVSMCASVAIWVAASLLGRNEPGRWRHYHTSEITDLGNRRTLAGHRAIPATGLTHGQMIDALQDMGYEAFDYNCPQLDLAYWFCAAYVDSGIPLVLELEYPGDGHAVTVVGYRTNKEHRSDIGEVAGYFSSDFVESILVQDDGAGPLRQIKLEKWENLEIYRGGNTNGQMTDEWADVKRGTCLAADTTDPSKPKVVGALTVIIAPAAGEVILEGSVALSVLRSQADLWLTFAEVPPPWIFRTYLVQSNRLKQHWSPARGLRDDMAKQLRSANLPKWIWVMELADFEGWRKGVNLGMLALDAASYVQDAIGRDFSVIHVPGVLVLTDPFFHVVCDVQPDVRYPPFRLGSSYASAKSASNGQ